MTWHSTVVPADRLGPLVDSIRDLGGTVTESRPQPDGVHVTWTTATDGDLDPR